jgi:hypothetical protein
MGTHSRNKITVPQDGRPLDGHVHANNYHMRIANAYADDPVGNQANQNMARDYVDGLNDNAFAILVAQVYARQAANGNNNGNNHNDNDEEENNDTIIDPNTGEIFDNPAATENETEVTVLGERNGTLNSRHITSTAQRHAPPPPRGNQNALNSIHNNNGPRISPQLNSNQTSAAIHGSRNRIIRDEFLNIHADPSRYNNNVLFNQIDYIANIRALIFAIPR